MINAIDVFKSVLTDTKSSGVLYEYLENVVKPPIDFSDILRWQWAQSVSALDKLIHDLVRIGMVQIYIGNRVATSKYQAFTLPLETHSQILQNPNTAILLFEKQIFLKLGFLSFQDPEKIADALSFIWDEPHKWDKISVPLGMSEADAKTKLKNISIRRNQIVHEGDYSNSLLQRQSLVYADVIDVIGFVEKIGESIYNQVK